MRYANGNAVAPVCAHEPEPLQLNDCFPAMETRSKYIAEMTIVIEKNYSTAKPSTVIISSLITSALPMPTIFSHPAVPLAIGLALGSRIIPGRLLAAGVLASIVPDFDVAGLHMGIPYANELGHRGASHSLVFAIVLGLLAAAFARQLRAARPAAFLFIAASAVSHGLLDMLTTGGLGVALAWPVSDARLFFPLRVIRVSPLSVKTFLSARGLAVMMSELLWVWLPAALAGLALHLGTRKQGKPARQGKKRA